MLKLLFKCLFLSLVVLAIVVYVGSFDLKTGRINDNVIRVKTAVLFDSLDYLFIGNSYTYSGINPVYFDSVGVNSYNLGVSTSGPYYYDIIIEDYLKGIKQAPKCIVMVVSPITFSERSDNWELYPIHRYLNYPLSNLEIAKRFSLGLKASGVFQKSFVKGASVLIQKGQKEDRELEREVYNIKGFNRQNSALNQQRQDDISVYKKFAELKFDHSKANYLEKLIEKLNSKKIKVVLHEVPTLNVDAYFNKDYIKEYNQWILERNTEGIKIIKNTLTLDKSCFRNIDHLNEKGAGLFTMFLRDKLKD